MAGGGGGGEAAAAAAGGELMEVSRMVGDPERGLAAADAEADAPVDDTRLPLLDVLVLAQRDKQEEGRKE